jgi:hypothetical protein
MFLINFTAATINVAETIPLHCGIVRVSYLLIADNFDEGLPDGFVVWIFAILALQVEQEALDATDTATHNATHTATDAPEPG